MSACPECGHSQVPRRPGCCAERIYQNGRADAGLVDELRLLLSGHPHADTCASALSPGADYPCSCWQGTLRALLPLPRPAPEGARLSHRSPLCRAYGCTGDKSPEGAEEGAAGDVEALVEVIGSVPGLRSDDVVTVDVRRLTARVILAAGYLSPTQAAAHDARVRAEAPGSSWRERLADKVFQDALLATAGLMETQRISPECRNNRTVEGAWDEAVRQLREIYDAQVEHDPTTTIGLSIGRERADRIDGGASC